jgi:poly(3-hydroxybutyrate) depolymerase
VVAFLSDSVENKNACPAESAQPWAAEFVANTNSDKIKKAMQHAKEDISWTVKPIQLFYERYSQDKKQIEAGKNSGFDIKPSRTVSIDDLKSGFDFKPGEDIKVEFPDVTDNLSSKHEKRYFFLHIPTNFDPSKKAPLGLLFNGLGPVGQAEFPSFSGMQNASNKYGVITAYLEGIEPQHTFNNGQWPFNVHNTDDLALVGRMLKQLEIALPVDQKRIYTGGFSNGGSFGLQVALKYPIAANGGVESWLPDTSPNLHPKPEEPPKPQPFSNLDIYGRRDPVIPEIGSQGLKDEKAAWSKAYDMSYTGAALAELYINETTGAPYVNQPINNLLHVGMQLSMGQRPGQGDKFVVESKQYTTDYMRDLDHIPNQQPTKVDQNKYRTISQWFSPANGTEVEQVMVPENEHAWPGSEDHRRDVPLIGTPELKVDAAELIMQFWLRHSLDDRNEKPKP